MPTDMLLVPAALHGGDRVAPDTVLAKRFAKAKLNALRKAFAQPVVVCFAAGKIVEARRDSLALRAGSFPLRSRRYAGEALLGSVWPFDRMGDLWKRA